MTLKGVFKLLLENLKWKMYKDLEISFLFRKCEIENLEKCSTNFSVKKSEIENPEGPRNF